MTQSTSTQATETSWTRDYLDMARPYLRGRRILFVLAGLAAVAALALSWDWLAAIGVASLLLTALPCLVMCALGLCMHRMGGRSCSTGTAAPPPSAQLQPPQETKRSEHA
jgi:hypothetical protein